MNLAGRATSTDGYMVVRFLDAAQLAYILERDDVLRVTHTRVDIVEKIRPPRQKLRFGEVFEKPARLYEVSGPVVFVGSGHGSFRVWFAAHTAQPYYRITGAKGSSLI